MQRMKTSMKLGLLAAPRRGWEKGCPHLRGRENDRTSTFAPRSKPNRSRSRSSSRSRLASILLCAIVLSATATVFVGLPEQARATPSSYVYFDHVVFIAMENQNYPDVMDDGHGTAEAPYIASLLASGATAPSYHGRYCGSGSENNYLALISGDTWGCPGNGARDIGTTTTRTIVDLFEGAGVTWHAYCEASCGRGGDHFPWTDFVSITSSPERMSHVTESGASTTDLVNAVGASTPDNFIWWTPEDSHNMHDNSISSGDSYLQGFVPSILSKPIFTSGRALLVLWWDEYDPAPFLIIGPTVTKGLISARTDVEHYTVTRLIEDNWAMPSLTVNDASQGAMSEFFAAGSAGLSASFTYLPTAPLTNTVVAFTAIAAGGSSPYNFAWNLGDGATATGSSTTHSYVSAGAYTVTLTVTDNTNGTFSTSRTVAVTLPPPLTADFSLSLPLPFAGQTITLQGSASGGRSPYGYAWNLGDSGTASGSTVSHSYSQEGTYTVTLTVTDSDNTQAIVTKPVVIAPPPSQVLTTFDFTDAAGIDVTPEVTIEVWNGNSLVTTLNPVDLDPLITYELRIFYMTHQISSETFQPQASIHASVFMYKHQSAPDGYIALDSPIDSLTIAEQTTAKLKFTASGTGSSYTIIVKAPKVPVSVLKDGSSYQFTFDQGLSIIIIHTTSLSEWELSFENTSQPPPTQPPGNQPSDGQCFLCFPFPTSLVSSIWLIVLGGIAGLTASLAILTARAHSKLNRARKLNMLERD